MMSKIIDKRKSVAPPALKRSTAKKEKELNTEMFKVINH